LDEVQEQHTGERGEGEGVPLGPAAGRRQPVGQALECRAKRLEEARRDPFARERFADAQTERERRFPGEGTEAFQRLQRATRRSLEGDRRDAYPLSARARAPAGADETPRAQAPGASAGT